MIRTKDLINFVLDEKKTWNTQEMEYNMEIAARLRAYDKLCHEISNLIDKLKGDNNEKISKTWRKSLL